MERVANRRLEPVQVDPDELHRLAAREYIALALEAERGVYLEDDARLLDEDGRRLVVGHGHGRQREVTTAAGAVEVRAPRVRDRRDGEHFVSALLPPYLRRSPKIAAVLPLLYLHGLSSGDFVPAINPIESTFAMLRLRQRVTKGPGSRVVRPRVGVQAHAGRGGGLAPHSCAALVALVKAGAVFVDGRLREGRDQQRGFAA